jgi:hypothetical protein
MKNGWGLRQVRTGDGGLARNIDWNVNVDSTSVRAHQLSFATVCSPSSALLSIQPLVVGNKAWSAAACSDVGFVRCDSPFLDGLVSLADVSPPHAVVYMSRSWKDAVLH